MSTAPRAPGWVPSMNHSDVVARVHGPGLPPVHASIVARTTPFGPLELGDRQPPCSRGRTHATAARPRSARSPAVRERGFEWSLLPIQTPIASAGASDRLGGARNPYVARSRASLAVPVLTAAGRRLPARAVVGSPSLADQIGFCFGSVLPGEDVGDEERGLWRDGRRRLPAFGRPPDDLAVRAADLEDHPRRHVGAAVRDRPEGRGQVERPDLDRPERTGQAGLQEQLRARR